MNMDEAILKSQSVAVVKAKKCILTKELKDIIDVNATDFAGMRANYTCDNEAAAAFVLGIWNDYWQSFSGTISYNFTDNKWESHMEDDYNVFPDENSSLSDMRFLTDCFDIPHATPFYILIEDLPKIPVQAWKDLLNDPDKVLDSTGNSNIKIVPAIIMVTFSNTDHVSVDSFTTLLNNGTDSGGNPIIIDSTGKYELMNISQNNYGFRTVYDVHKYPYTGTDGRSYIHVWWEVSFVPVTSNI